MNATRTYKNKYGYIDVKAKWHHRARPNGCVSLHVIVAEKALGHTLPQGAVVHHHDKNRENNQTSNLVICEDAKYHQLLHQRMDAIHDGVNPDIEQRCASCRIIKPLTDFVLRRSRWNGRDRNCTECHRGFSYAARRKAGCAFAKRLQDGLNRATEHRCITCLEIKPLSAFHRSKSRKDGVEDRCKTCRHQQNMGRL